MKHFHLQVTMMAKEQIWFSLHFTCLKVFFETLQAVSTVNFVLKMLQSLAPYPLRPPEEQYWTMWVRILEK